MCVCGLFRPVKALRFVWKQSYKDLLPPVTIPTYVCGQRRLPNTSVGKINSKSSSSNTNNNNNNNNNNNHHHHNNSSGVPVVVESPSDAAGILTFLTDSTEAAVSSLHDVAQSTHKLSYTDRCCVLDNLSTLLTENSELLASSEALVTGMCLRDARRSIQDAVKFIVSCRQRLQTHKMISNNTDVDIAYVDDVLCTLGYTDSMTHNEDACLALCFSAANFPLQWGMELVAAAITRGSTAVWIPSLEAPLSALWLIHLLSQEQKKNRSKDTETFPHEALSIILCRGDQVVRNFIPQLNENQRVIGLTNGFGYNEINCNSGSSKIPSGSNDTNIMQRCRWHHRMSKSSIAIVGLNHNIPSSSSSSLSLSITTSLDVQQIAKRICHDAFHCNGRTLHPLHLVFIPQEHILSVLRGIVQHIRQLRVGHSLDPAVDIGPLPGAAHLNAMKSAVEMAVCCSDVHLQQVCGGFELAMPAGFFCTPCVLYGTVANVHTAAESENAIRVMCVNMAKIRSELNPYGGGPLLVVCGYNPQEQQEGLELVLHDTTEYVIHYW
ncbi:uncharacterized protein TM35_000261560 [Trypanosoma theileri]|uniref:Aldehyde dehydrogenase domain-containing protein n=1 Tax=Trypanosoma theileri TaxID=67003 RepID=A0A1X0NPT4_9TRYP|nr:uncharacterized protein TM35_000261560 [Trypanosoma theileri]ORC86704.1 hypothetical protein TM35_000261560 [Trypanosoma theileri]